MKTSFITFLCLITLATAAQVPQAFKYQMVLRDASGEILSNQLVSVRVSIHETTSGGPIIYQETFSATSNQFGLVNLEIGNGTVTLGNFSTIDWGGDPKFIRTEVDPAGGTNYITMGTSELLSVPFALYSERSKDSPWELSGNNLYYSDGFVGINKNNPEVHLDVHGEIRSYQPGTATGEIYLSGPLASPGIVMFSNLPERYRTNIIRLTTGLGFGVHASSNSPGYSTFFIHNDGNLGVGTNEPQTLLQLSSDTQFDPGDLGGRYKGSLLLNLVGGTQGLDYYSAGIAFGGINTSRRRAAIAGVQTSTDSDHFGLAFFTHPGSSTSNDIVMEAMRLTHGGNLGIGSTAPETMLHVNTDTKFNPGDYAGREKGALLLSLIGGSTGFHQCGPAVAFSGINTSRRRAAIAAIQTDWDADQVGLAFYTHPGTTATNDEVTQMMVITHDGLVGINTVTPTSRLDVTGNIAVRDESTGIIAVEIGTGLDYAEGFDVAENDNIAPGTVLCIDPDHPGKLKISEKAYDTKVAGIVAGANQLGSGVTLGTGEHDLNVALAGRVYCNADATESAIEAGDLLTTSEVPGYAKKVMDPLKAQGAVLGKAMQGLEKGKKGQVLVLVTLQ